MGVGVCVCLTVDPFTVCLSRSILFLKTPLSGMHSLWAIVVAELFVNASHNLQMHILTFIFKSHTHIYQPHPYRLFYVFTDFLQMCTYLQIVLLELWPIYFICCLCMYLLQAHTLFDMPFQCLFKSANVFQFSGVMMQLEHWSNIQFPHHSVFCLGSQ